MTDPTTLTTVSRTGSSRLPTTGATASTTGSVQVADGVEDRCGRVEDGGDGTEEGPVDYRSDRFSGRVEDGSGEGCGRAGGRLDGASDGLGDDGSDGLGDRGGGIEEGPVDGVDYRTDRFHHGCGRVEDGFGEVRGGRVDRRGG